MDHLKNLFIPVMTVELFASSVGLPVGVVSAQVDRGYWPVIRVGKRVLINVEAVRVSATKHAQEFSL